MDVRGANGEEVPILLNNLRVRSDMEGKYFVSKFGCGSCFVFILVTEKFKVNQNKTFQISVEQMLGNVTTYLTFKRSMASSKTSYLSSEIQIEEKKVELKVYLKDSAGNMISDEEGEKEIFVRFNNPKIGCDFDINLKDQYYNVITFIIYFRDKN